MKKQSCKANKSSCSIGKNIGAKRCIMLGVRPAKNDILISSLATGLKVKVVKEWCDRLSSGYDLLVSLVLLRPFAGFQIVQKRRDVGCIFFEIVVVYQFVCFLELCLVARVMEVVDPTFLKRV